jgi:hypothetical protein
MQAAFQIRQRAKERPSAASAQKVQRVAMTRGPFESAIRRVRVATCRRALKRSETYVLSLIRGVPLLEMLPPCA